MLIHIGLFSSNVSAADSSKLLFSEKELDQLEGLKNSRELLLKNQQKNYQEQVDDLFRAQLLIMGKLEINRRKEFGAIKELENFDQHWLFNRILDRRLKQIWQRDEEDQNP